MTIIFQFERNQFQQILAKFDLIASKFDTLISVFGGGGNEDAAAAQLTDQLKQATDPLQNVIDQNK